MRTDRSIKNGRNFRMNPSPFACMQYLDQIESCVECSHHVNGLSDFQLFERRHLRSNFFAACVLCTLSGLQSLSFNHFKLMFIWMEIN